MLIKIARGLLVVGGLFLLFGGVGGMECDTLPLMKGTIISVAGLVMMTLGIKGGVDK